MNVFTGDSWITSKFRKRVFTFEGWSHSQPGSPAEGGNQQLLPAPPLPAASRLLWLRAGGR